MPRVVHFEIRADDPDRAVAFYQGVFGWKITKWDGPMDYWFVATGDADEPGIDGAIMARENQVTVSNTIDVPSIDDFTRKITEAGGRIVSPKNAVPGVGYACYCTDIEGNMFGLIQNDPSAK